MKIHIEGRLFKIDVEHEPMELYKFYVMWAMLCVMVVIISITSVFR